MDNTINWKYFFGYSGKNTARFYEAEFNGVRIEKRMSKNRTIYSVGNIDKAKITYNTEIELLTSLNE